MTPAEQLAAARANVVGPYLPARLEWLDGWCGPLTADVEHYGVGLSCIQAPGRHGPMMGLFEVHFRFGGIVMDAEVPLSAIRLDTRIPAVRDHLVRLGCPEWARDVPAAVWCWGMTGVAPTRLRCQWREVYRHYADPAVPISADATVWCRSEQAPNNGGHRLFADDAEGRACADVAALNAGCILREPGGWLVPMPDGGIGFFEEVSRDE